MRKGLFLLLLLPFLAFAQQFEELETGGQAFFNFIRTGIQFLLVGGYLGAFAFGVFLLVKKVRSAMTYAKQSGDEDPAWAGAKTAIPWGAALFAFALLVGTLINFVTGGVFMTIVRLVLLGEGGE